MRPTGTRIAAVMDGLVAFLGDQLSDLGVQVVDGPRAAQELAPDVVLLGVSEGNSIEVTQTRQGLGGRTDERFTIWGVISTWRGDTEMSPRRLMAATILDRLDRVERVPDVADELGLGEEISWAQDQSPDGAVVEVAFQITGKALR